MKSRRDLLKGAALAVTTAAIATIPAAARSITAPVGTPPTPDPFVELGRRLLRAERRYNRISALHDRAEGNALQAGFSINRPFMMVGMRHCGSAKDIEHAAAEAGFSPERGAQLARIFRSRLAHQRRQRTAAGLDAIDAKLKAARAEYWRLYRAVAKAPAMSIAGLAVKIRLMAAEITEGHTDHGDRLARGAVRDAKRLAAG